MIIPSKKFFTLSGIFGKPEMITISIISIGLLPKSIMPHKPICTPSLLPSTLSLYLIKTTLMLLIILRASTFILQVLLRTLALQDSSA
jgi:hypothetical protein